MSLHKNIKEQIQTSMKEKDHEKLEVLRAMLSAFTNELVATKRTPQDELKDEEALKVVQKLAKQHKDSIEQYRNAKRNDLVEEEKAQLEIVKEYLPQMMTRDDIKKLAITKRNEMNIIKPTQKGILIGMLMKDLQGKADGSEVKNVVEEIFEEK